MSEYTVLRATDAPDFTASARRRSSATGARWAPSRSRSTCACWRRGDARPARRRPGRRPQPQTIEEIYFVLEGEITVKLGDDVVTLGPRDAVLIPAGTPAACATTATPPAAFAMVSVKVEDQMAETNSTRLLAVG